MVANQCNVLLVLGLAIQLMVPCARAFRNVAAGGIDWGAATDVIKEIDRTKESDAFVVFQSSSDVEFDQVARPPLGKVSLETFKDALRACGPRKKVCIGFYKINYPVFVGSNTFKEKALLVMAVADKMSIMVKMPVTQFVWPPLKQHLRDIGVAPSATLELIGSRKIDGLNVDDVWKTLAGRASRVDAEEVEAFKLHEEQQIQNALLGGSVDVVIPPTDTSDDDTESAEPSSGSQPSAGGQPSSGSQPSSGGASGMIVDPKMIEDLVERKMEAVEAKVEKIVEAKAKEMAVKAAQDEVGRAIRKLGDKVEDAYTSVGKMWIDKAKR